MSTICKQGTDTTLWYTGKITVKFGIEAHSKKEAESRLRERFAGYCVTGVEICIDQVSNEGEPK